MLVSFAWPSFYRDHSLFGVRFLALVTLAHVASGFFLLGAQDGQFLRQQHHVLVGERFQFGSGHLLDGRQFQYGLVIRGWFQFAKYQWRGAATVPTGQAGGTAFAIRRHNRGTIAIG